jgi:ribosomal protein L11 methyltransferase
VSRTWPAIVVSGLARADPSTALGASPSTALTAIDAELIHATLASHSVAAIDEPSEDQWRIFFSDAADRDAALAALRERFPGLRLDPLDVADENWAARSPENLRAVQVGRIIVAPPWDAPITIVIRPSMGFGTGHHATTRLCLAALQRISLDRCTVLDVGAGSGVLAIAASRLGAEEVTGIDDDQDAIQSAWDNLSLNPSAQVTLIVGDLKSTDLVPADTILANLTGGLLIQSAERLRKLTNAHGRLILSGFRTDEERDVLAAFGAFTVEHRGEEGGWVCLTLKES